jgi:ankyrin repeat protein
LLDRGADPNFLGFNAAPVLHWAAFSGNQALVRLLLERGSDPARLDGSYHATYRVFAIRNAIEWSLHRALARILAADRSLARERDASWGPPLNAAAEKGLDDHVQTLLEYGADPLETDAAGRTALQCARVVLDVSARARVVAMLEAQAPG